MRVALAIVLLLVVTPGAVAQDPLDEVVPCYDLQPDSIASPTSDRNQLIDVRVLVVHSGVSEDEASAAMQRTAELYEPVGIDLTVAAYMPMDLTPDTGTEMINDVRRRLGGTPPPWAHMVLTITRDGPTDAMGEADCAGGIRHPEESFAVLNYVEPNTGRRDLIVGRARGGASARVPSALVTRVSGRQARRMRRAGRVRLVLVVRALDAAGNARTIRRAIRVR